MPTKKTKQGGPTPGKSGIYGTAPGRGPKPADVAPPPMYRRDLLLRAKRDSYLGFREIAGYTKLSVNTVTQAFEGNASKLETLWKLSKFFGIPWIALFDVDKNLRVVPCNESGEQVRFEIIDGDLVGLQGANR